METIVGSVTSDLLSKAMDVCYENHKVIANNIANVESVSYVPLKLDFESIFNDVKQHVHDSDKVELQKSIDALDTENMQAQVQISEWGSLENGMVELTQNTLRFNALVDMRIGLGSIYSTAISGGKK